MTSDQAPRGGPAGAAEAHAAGLRAQWKESERRMYPLATTVPEKYEQVVRIARRLADDLGNVRSADELDARWAGHELITRSAADGAGVPVGDLPVSDIAGVGFALRDAELRASDHERTQRELVVEARERGDDWVTLHETGRLDRGLVDKFQAIELHLRTGAAIVAAVEAHPATGRENHMLTVIKMDPFSGAPTDIDPGIADVQEFDGADEFLAAREALYTLIERL